MATREELYISISPESYKLNKSNVLMGQADLLESLKRLYNLRVLARQKHDLKKKLHKLFTAVLSDVASIQNKMPEPKLPKSIQKVEKTKEKAKANSSKYQDIEDELKLISEKLRELNS